MKRVSVWVAGLIVLIALICTMRVTFRSGEESRKERVRSSQEGEKNPGGEVGFQESKPLRNEHAGVALDTQVTTEGFQYSIPSDWVAVVTPPNMVRHQSPSSLKGRSMFVQVTTGQEAQREIALDVFEKTIRESQEKTTEELLESIGRVSGGRQPLGLEDIRPQGTEMMEIDGEKILRSQSMSIAEIGNDPVVFRRIVCIRNMGNRLDIFMITGPMDLFDDYEREINAIMKTVRPGETP